jgi:L-ascorbate metabolism protein UlaG (beta-lactamase superfamily)
MDAISITSLGNAGFHISSSSHNFLFDPVPALFPDRMDKILQYIDSIPSLDMILITHSHWDHCDVRFLTDAAQMKNAMVIGPEPVMKKLAILKSKGLTRELQPENRAAGGSYPYVSITQNGMSITAFNTFHGQSHNSYLVEVDGWRILHDGDNERTQEFSRSDLRFPDIVLLCPWQGSGWVEFLESVHPSWWILQHLDEEELLQHQQNQFLSNLCDRVPMQPVSLNFLETKMFERIGKNHG